MAGAGALGANLGFLQSSSPGLAMDCGEDSLTSSGKTITTKLGQVVAVFVTMKGVPSHTGALWLEGRASITLGSIVVTQHKPTSQTNYNPATSNATIGFYWMAFGTK